MSHRDITGALPTIPANLCEDLSSFMKKDFNPVEWINEQISSGNLSISSKDATSQYKSTISSSDALSRLTLRLRLLADSSSSSIHRSLNHIQSTFTKSQSTAYQLTTLVDRIEADLAQVLTTISTLRASSATTVESLAQAHALREKLVTALYHTRRAQRANMFLAQARAAIGPSARQCLHAARLLYSARDAAYAAGTAGRPILEDAIVVQRQVLSAVQAAAAEAGYFAGQSLWQPCASEAAVADERAWRGPCQDLLALVVAVNVAYAAATEPPRSQGLVSSPAFASVTVPHALLGDGSTPPAREEEDRALAAIPLAVLTGGCDAMVACEHARVLALWVRAVSSAQDDGVLARTAAESEATLTTVVNTVAVRLRRLVRGAMAVTVCFMPCVHSATHAATHMRAGDTLPSLSDLCSLPVLSRAGWYTLSPLLASLISSTAATLASLAVAATETRMQRLSRAGDTRSHKPGDGHGDARGAGCVPGDALADGQRNVSAALRTLDACTASMQSVVVALASSLSAVFTTTVEACGMAGQGTDDTQRGHAHAQQSASGYLPSTSGVSIQNSGFSVLNSGSNLDTHVSSLSPGASALPLTTTLLHLLDTLVCAAYAPLRQATDPTASASLPLAASLLQAHVHATISAARTAAAAADGIESSSHSSSSSPSSPQPSLVALAASLSAALAPALAPLVGALANHPNAAVLALPACAEALTPVLTAAAKAVYAASLDNPLESSRMGPAGANSSGDPTQTAAGMRGDARGGQGASTEDLHSSSSSFSPSSSADGLLSHLLLQDASIHDLKLTLTAITTRARTALTRTVSQLMPLLLSPSVTASVDGRGMVTGLALHSHPLITVTHTTDPVSAATATSTSGSIPAATSTPDAIDRTGAGVLSEVSVAAAGSFTLPHNDTSSSSSTASASSSASASASSSSSSSSFSAGCTPSLSWRSSPLGVLATDLLQPLFPQASLAAPHHPQHLSTSHTSLHGILSPMHGSASAHIRTPTRARTRTPSRAPAGALDAMAEEDPDTDTDAADDESILADQGNSYSGNMISGNLPPMDVFSSSLSRTEDLDDLASPFASPSPSPSHAPPQTHVDPLLMPFTISVATDGLQALFTRLSLCPPLTASSSTSTSTSDASSASASTINNPGASVAVVSTTAAAVLAARANTNTSSATHPRSSASSASSSSSSQHLLPINILRETRHVPLPACLSPAPASPRATSWLAALHALLLSLPPPSSPIAGLLGAVTHVLTQSPHLTHPLSLAPAPCPLSPISTTLATSITHVQAALTEVILARLQQPLTPHLLLLYTPAAVDPHAPSPPLTRAAELIFSRAQALQGHFGGSGKVASPQHLSWHERFITVEHDAAASVATPTATALVSDAAAPTATATVSSPTANNEPTTRAMSNSPTEVLSDALAWWREGWFAAEHTATSSHWLGRLGDAVVRVMAHRLLAVAEDRNGAPAAAVNDNYELSTTPGFVSVAEVLEQARRDCAYLRKVLRAVDASSGVLKALQLVLESSPQAVAVDAFGEVLEKLAAADQQWLRRVARAVAVQSQQHGK